jgi:hypothetical protein
MKQMMQINGVCEYTKICENEANKIHIRLEANKRLPSFSFLVGKRWDCKRTDINV